jgi:hypothetical protein
MERGLMWLPLLGVFIWLARLGSREYRQIQVYQDWAQGFDRHKYDIYAVLGWRDRQLTWGKATPAGVEVAGSFSLDAVVGIELCKNGQAIPVAADSARLKGGGDRRTLHGWGFGLSLAIVTREGRSGKSPRRLRFTAIFDLSWYDDERLKSYCI